MAPGALVLAAGAGSRLKPLHAGPKPLVPFGPLRLIEWNLVWLAGHGMGAAWINLHHGAAQIRGELGDGARYGLSLRYSTEPELLGTAGAWKKLRSAWKGTSVVVYGDNVSRFDLTALLQRHASAGMPATVAVFDPERTANTGMAGGRATVVEGRIDGFAEGGAHGLVNAGVYALEPAIADLIGAGYQDFGRDVLPRLAAAGQLAAHVLEEGSACLGLDTPESYAQGLDLLRRGVIRP
jgi:mannose-1-phosphate guanylyltransferase